MNTEIPYERFRKMREEGQSFQQIVDVFNQENWRSPMGKPLSISLLSNYLVSYRKRKKKEAPLKKPSTSLQTLYIEESKKSGKFLAILGDRDDLKELVREWMNS